MGVIFGAVNIMATETSDATAVHHALHEIIALHTVLVRGPISKMCESGVPQFVFFELPIITEFESRAIAHWPVVIFAFNGVGDWASL